MTAAPELWAVHTLGMDDLHPCASRRLAVRNATWMNLGLAAHLSEWDDDLTPFVYNVPGLFSWDPAAHASALAAMEKRDPRWSDPTADVIGDLSRETHGPEVQTWKQRAKEANGSAANLRDALNRLADHVPDTYEQRSSAEAMVTAWLDDREAELTKLREFARQVAPVILEEFKPVVHDDRLMPWTEAHLDQDVLEDLTELAEGLDLGWEARA